MKINNCEINVLIKGRAITNFFHRGQTFLEGREGSNYEIEFKNNNNFNVEVILSVDGLSVTDGKLAGQHSTGYIVDANCTIRVPGWTLDNAQAAAFAFSGKSGGSYAEQATGSAENKGVIGALVFKEKPKPPSYAKTAYPLRGIMSQPFNGNPMWSSDLGGGSMPLSRGMSSGPINATTSSIASSGADSYPLNNTIYGASLFSEPVAVEQTLGTAFGEATTFQTTTVQFERGDMVCMMEMFYDNLEGLKKRGIVIPVRNTAPSPKAFPAMQTGCKPPAGWQG